MGIPTAIATDRRRGSFILGSLDDVIAFAAFVVTTFLGPIALV